MGGHAGWGIFRGRELGGENRSSEAIRKGCDGLGDQHGFWKRIYFPPDAFGNPSDMANFIEKNLKTRAAVK